MRRGKKNPFAAPMAMVAANSRATERASAAMNIPRCKKNKARVQDRARPSVTGSHSDHEVPRRVGRERRREKEADDDLRGAQLPRKEGEEPVEDRPAAELADRVREGRNQDSRRAGTRKGWNAR